MASVRSGRAAVCLVAAVARHGCCTAAVSAVCWWWPPANTRGRGMAAACSGSYRWQLRDCQSLVLSIRASGGAFSPMVLFLWRTLARRGCGCFSALCGVHVFVILLHSARHEGRGIAVIPPDSLFPVAGPQFYGSSSAPGISSAPRVLHLLVHA